MLNTLKLVAVDEHHTQGVLYQVQIDNIPLLDMFTEFESRYSSSINGAYTDTLTTDIIKNNLSEVGKCFTPLACDCGEWECWFITGEVLTYDEFVCWGKWVNPYRSDRTRKAEGMFWSYKEFPAIVFEAKQYQDEINRVLGNQ
ncbi:hypothetical protein [Paraglaciecola sp. 2405UD69-4]|uniref:hypothetical protein n=1 Tax=Paraglaciecola sp. 2405UD69-4 TaxID=3391836 RepID=UPI0039C9A905